MGLFHICLLTLEKACQKQGLRFDIADAKLYFFPDAYLSNRLLSRAQPHLPSTGPHPHALTYYDGQEMRPINLKAEANSWELSQKAGGQDSAPPPSLQRHNFTGERRSQSGVRIWGCRETGMAGPAAIPARPCGAQGCPDGPQVVPTAFLCELSSFDNEGQSYG